MINIHNLTVSVPGFGVFNQKYELERISFLFKNFAEYSKAAFDHVKEIKLDFPGWRTFSETVIKNIFKFLQKCFYLEDFSLNICHTMDLTPNKKEEEENHEEEFYGKCLFKTQ